MKVLVSVALTASLLLAAGCSSTTEVPAGGTGFSGTEATLNDGFGTAPVTGGTLPGTNISDTVLFPVDQTSVTAEAAALLDAQAGWLQSNPQMSVTIQGHADERGTGEYNMALGSGRASSVRNYLVTKGISDSRISIITFGRERPAATCPEESCFSQNRRSVTVATGSVGS